MFYYAFSFFKEVGVGGWLAGGWLSKRNIGKNDLISTLHDLSDYLVNGQWHNPKFSF